MDGYVDHIVHFLDSDEAELRAALEADPGLRDQFRTWVQVVGQVRKEFEADIPDAQALILYAMKQEGRLDGLSTDELDRLAKLESGIEASISAHPSVSRIVNQYRSDVRDFEALWNEEFAGEAPIIPLKQAPKVSRMGWVLKIAAAVAFVTFAGWFALTQLNGPEYVEIAADGLESVRLPDNSRIELVDGSVLRYLDGDAFDRQVELDGKALFTVSKSEMPFVVTTEHAEVTVLGTTFGLAETDDSTDLVLARGSVSFAPRTQEDLGVQLEPGQMSQIVLNGAPSAPVEVDVVTALSWTGLFVFRQTPSDRVEAYLSEAFGRPVIIDVGESVAVTGTFPREQPLESIVEILGKTLSAEVSVENGGFRLRR